MKEFKDVRNIFLIRHCKPEFKDEIKTCIEISLKYGM